MNSRSSVLSSLRAWVWLVVSVGALLSMGCGSKKATINGTVNYRGQPLPSGVIKFISAETNEIVGTTAIKDGNYSVSGIPTGLVKIVIHMLPTSTSGSNLFSLLSASSKKDTKDVVTQGGSKDNITIRPASKPVKIPAKYSKAETSGLTYMVQSGTQEAPPLNLQ